MIIDAFIDAVDFGNDIDVADVAAVQALTVIHHTLEQLSTSHTKRNVFICTKC